MSFSDPNQRFCEVNLSFGLSRRNFMALVKTGRAQWNPTAPAEPVEELATSAEKLPRLQKSYRGTEKPAGGYYLPRATTVLSAGAGLKLMRI